MVITRLLIGGHGGPKTGNSRLTLMVNRSRGNHVSGCRQAGDLNF